MENKTKILNANFYPFVVSEKDSNGCIQQKCMKFV